MTSGINALQIAAPSPNVAGGVWRAPLGTALPTDTSTALNSAFVSLGYIGEDGVTQKIDRANTPQFAWGGGKIASLQQHYDLTLTFRMLQQLDPDVLKAVHSDSNVTVTAPTSTVGTLTTTLLNPTLNVNSAWVIEGFYQTATLRLALPIGRVITVADLKWTHKELAAFDVTVALFPDTNGNFGYQYWNDGIHT